MACKFLIGDRVIIKKGSFAAIHLQGLNATVIETSPHATRPDEYMVHIVLDPPRTLDGGPDERTFHEDTFEWDTKLAKALE